MNVATRRDARAKGKWTTIDPARSTALLAQFAVDVQYDDLSPATIHATKRLILDTVGCAVGALELDAGRIVRDVKLELGGKPESTLLLSGQRLSCTSAAYVNAALAAMLDADDSCRYCGHHANNAILPALAVAERVGASGRDLIAAVAVCYEVAGRIGRSLRKTVEGRNNGEVYIQSAAGMPWLVFASVIGSGRLLGLTAEQMAHAMGIAASSTTLPTAGQSSAFVDSEYGVPMTKWGCTGAMAEAGVMAALLAQRGYQGDPIVLDHDHGFWRMAGAAGCNRAEFTDRLGERWLIEQTSIKPYPSCRFIHAALDLFPGIVREHGLRANEIDAVRVHQFAQGMKFQKPKLVNQFDAQFHTPYQIALLALGIPPGPQWAQHIEDPAVWAFADKVTLVHYPHADEVVREELANYGFRRLPTRVEVDARGMTYSADADLAWGDPSSPDTAMSDAELIAKFREMCVRQLPASRIDDAIATAFALDDKARAADFMAILG